MKRTNDILLDYTVAPRYLSKLFRMKVFLVLLLDKSFRYDLDKKGYAEPACNDYPTLENGLPEPSM